mmetsp:Transcript_43840/g.80061  ORF Transcript_43840/g.80061 Transcript_43840/m.80061 type:complete len:418 (+) Transcript_43840:1228-2481(+)
MAAALVLLASLEVVLVAAQEPAEVVPRKAAALELVSHRFLVVRLLEAQHVVHQEGLVVLERCQVHQVVGLLAATEAAWANLALAELPTLEVEPLVVHLANSLAEAYQAPGVPLGIQVAVDALADSQVAVGHNLVEEDLASVGSQGVARVHSHGHEGKAVADGLAADFGPCCEDDPLFYLCCHCDCCRGLPCPYHHLVGCLFHLHLFYPLCHRHDGQTAFLDLLCQHPYPDCASQQLVAVALGNLAELALAVAHVHLVAGRQDLPLVLCLLRQVHAHLVAALPDKGPSLGLQLEPRLGVHLVFPVARLPGDPFHRPCLNLGQSSLEVHLPSAVAYLVQGKVALEAFPLALMVLGLEALLGPPVCPRSPMLDEAACPAAVEAAREVRCQAAVLHLLWTMRQRQPASPDPLAPPLMPWLH